MNSMHDDKAFATWATCLIAGAASLVTALVVTGTVTLPTFASFVEHLALGLSIRFSYKWVGGFDWADWSIAGDPVLVVAPAAPAAPAVVEDLPAFRRAA